MTILFWFMVFLGIATGWICFTHPLRYRWPHKLGWALHMVAWIAIYYSISRNSGPVSLVSAAAACVGQYCFAYGDSKKFKDKIKA